MMRLELGSYSPDSRWPVAGLPDWDSPSTLVLAFAAPEYQDDPQPLQDLGAAFPRSCLLGCSTAGEIFGTRIHDRSLAVAVVQFSAVQLRRASAQIAHVAASFEAGRRISEQLADPRLRAVFVLADGLTVNGSELARGLNTRIGPGVVITGGMAGDGDRFARTWVLDEGLPRRGRVTAVGLYGEQLRVGHGSRGGWDIFGPERRVTRSRGNVLYELDGQPALELYKRYLGERAQALPGAALLFPLALRSAPDDGHQIVRTVVSVDEDACSMTFAGDVPQGHLAQLMRANFDRLVDGAIEAAQLAKAGQENTGLPTLAIAISCVGRRLVLGQRSEEEVESTLEILPDGTQQIGFYSYGELSPYTDGQCVLHNQTMTLTTLCELCDAPPAA